MNIRLTTSKFNVTPDVTERVNQKLGKLEKFFPSDAQANVHIVEQKNNVKVEITIFNHGLIFRAEVADKDYLCALDEAEDRMLRQIRKNRTRLEKQKYIRDDVSAPEDEIPEDADFLISRVKTVHLTPMSVEEAAMQMEMLSHQFFVFRNAETGAVNIVYRRNEKGYGVIVCLD